MRASIELPTFQQLGDGTHQDVVQKNVCKAHDIACGNRFMQGVRRIQENVGAGGLSQHKAL